MNKITKILWTGGWDSTFRILELLVHYKQKVQPIYILDSGRNSLLVEIQTMEKIRGIIERKYPKLSALLLSTMYINLSELKDYEDINLNYEKILLKSYVGIQVKYFARLIRQYKIKSIELGVHKDDKLYNALSGRGLTVKHKSPTGNYFTINSKYINKPIGICDSMRFPIFTLSKKDMEKLSQKMGFEEIMALTWFCHKPLAGNIPCGRCNPCRYTKEEYMGWRIPKYPRIKSYKYRISKYLA